MRPLPKGPADKLPADPNRGPTDKTAPDKVAAIESADKGEKRPRPPDDVKPGALIVRKDVDGLTVVAPPPQKTAKCPHGRVRARCKDCGGSSICSHGRRKSTCRECGGSAICTHGRQKHVASGLTLFFS